MLSTVVFKRCAGDSWWGGEGKRGEGGSGVPAGNWIRIRREVVCEGD